MENEKKKKITFQEYQDQALRTMSKEAKENPLLNAALGLSGETGEVADLIKKTLFQGHELDKEHLKEELGDVLWYLAEACKGLDTTLEEIALMNVMKLEKRFPDHRFDKEKSIHRELEKEL